MRPRTTTTTRPAKRVHQGPTQGGTNHSAHLSFLLLLPDPLSLSLSHTHTHAYTYSLPFCVCVCVCAHTEIVIESGIRIQHQSTFWGNKGEGEKYIYLNTQTDKSTGYEVLLVLCGSDPSIDEPVQRALLVVPNGSDHGRPSTIDQQVYPS